jgi:hypothetical protein
MCAVWLYIAAYIVWFSSEQYVGNTYEYDGSIQYIIR